MATPPFTWDEMRALGEPTRPLEACEICRHIPASCSASGSDDDIPSEVRRLESAGLPADDDDECLYRCPICHRLYRWSYSPYEYLAWGSEDERTSYTRLDTRQLFESRWYTAHRLADPRARAALAALHPGATQHALLEVADQALFPRHRFVQLAIADRRRWIILSDAGELVACTLAEVASIAAAEPPADVLERPIAYADFVDRVTTDDDYGHLVVDTFDDIPWRRDLTDDDRAYIEELRRASRVEPQHAERLGDRAIVRRWVVSHQRLISRVLTVWPTGELRREDAVVGELIPTHPGKTWSWDGARPRKVPSG